MVPKTRLVSTDKGDAEFPVWLLGISESRFRVVEVVHVNVHNHCS